MYAFHGGHGHSHGGGGHGHSHGGKSHCSSENGHNPSHSNDGGAHHHGHSHGGNANMQGLFWYDEWLFGNVYFKVFFFMFWQIHSVQFLLLRVLY